jgi:Na+/proline symporter
MVSSEHTTGLYVTVSVYFVLLGASAFWASSQNKKEVGESGIASGHFTDRLSSHYLGGRALGPVLTIGTVFASFFSGYTIVGIPKEAYGGGFLAFRWVAMALAVITGMSVSSTLSQGCFQLWLAGQRY